ncbi:MAG: TonB-dependent receptor [Bacteroidia bacterium]|nr:TonB-dependent receptor [Bacteroidia bacterium]
MRKVVLLLVFIFSISALSYSQGTVRGKVTDETGQSIIGAVVTLKSKPALGVTTDLDGNFSIKITDSTAQILVVSFLGYVASEESVHPLHGAVLLRNFTLKPKAKEISEVTVIAKAVRSKEYYVETIKRNSATTLDFVSSESMKKTGDANVVAAISRVTGVSTNGSFITVRGIGDRYVKTSINGMRIPTLDPFTNNIKLDLFPASLIDNIMITKTASPDLPGDWAGAYISVQTKDFPDQLSLNIETAFGYNSQSTFKDVLSSQRSSTDWLGYDNGFREHNHQKFTGATTSPSAYQEFVALGLGPYFNSLGITQQNWGLGTSVGETYFNLGLVQLGLLAPAQINDPNAVSAAKSMYTSGEYKNEAFDILNANVPATGRSFPNNWNTVNRKAPLNFTQSFSLGNQTKFLGRPLGFSANVRYGRSLVYDPGSVANRASIVSDGNGNLINSVSSTSKQQISKETNGWSALFTTAYKVNQNNSISLLFMPNFTGTNNVLNSLDDRDPANFVITKSQFYEQRKQLVYQLKTDHYLPGSKVKIDLNASYTNGNSSAPDFKNVQYTKDSYANTYQIGPEIRDGIHRYYRYLSDNIFDSQLSAEFPLQDKPGLPRKLKLGGAYQQNNRESDQFDYSVNFGEYSNLELINDNLEQLFDPHNFDIHTFTDAYGVDHQTIDCYYSETGSPSDHTFGESKIAAAFLMLDYSILPSLRFSGGIRVEQANTLTDVEKFDSLGYAPNDPRRNYRDGIPLANPGKLNEISYLPSANIIYKLRSDELAPVNLRFNFSQTIARPSIRELSDVAVFDYEYRAFVFGNSDLKMVHINNYDLRLESYFKSGDNVSVSLFYKAFKNHIELVKSAGYSWQNVDKSSVAGIEIEGRKQLTKHFEFRANVTGSYSKTEFVRTRMEISGGVKNYIPQDTVKRTMFGQAPYVLNGILAYTADSLGLTVSLSYNVQGNRLVVAADVKEIPDIYELPRNLVDIKISKTIGKHFTLGLAVRDILNSSVVRSYNYSDGTKLDYDAYRYGTNYIFSVAYKL